MIVSILSGCSKPEESEIPAGYAKATNDAVEYEYLYPSTWTLDRNDGLIKVIITPEDAGDSSNITSVTSQLDSSITTLADYFNKYADNFKETFTDYELVGEPKEVENTYTVSYKGKIAGVEYKFLQQIRYNNRTGYIHTFTYTSPTGYYDLHIEQVQAVFDSISFK